MKKKTMLITGVLAMVLVVPMAHAAKGDWMISLGGGAGIPVGNYSKSSSSSSSDTLGFAASTGFVVGPSFDYMVSDQVGIGVDGVFASNKLKKEFLSPGEELKYTQLGGGVHIKYMFPMSESRVSPYLLGGLGVTNFKAKATVGGVSGDVSKTGLSGRAGLGLGYKATDQVSIGLESDFNYVRLKKEDWAGNSSAPLFGVKAVVSFNMANPTQ